MLKYYMTNANKAGVGLECLPGVKQLLQELKVCSFCESLIACLHNQVSACSKIEVHGLPAMHCRNPFVKYAMGSHRQSKLFSLSQSYGT